MLMLLRALLLLFVVHVDVVCGLFAVVGVIV